MGYAIKSSQKAVDDLEEIKLTLLCI